MRKPKRRFFVSAVMILLLAGTAALAAIPDSQRQALIALYNATGGDSWTYKSGWKDGTLHSDGFALPGTEGSWYGVTVETDNVTWVSLAMNNLTGSIPAALSGLTALQMLNLGNNQLTGSIPSSIGSMTTLQQIYFSYNQLSGSIPAEIGNLTNLIYLYLPNNQFSGSIPSSLGNMTNLQQLWLSSNQLTGSIPSELGNLTKIQLLYLQANQLSGSIPASLGNLTECIELMLYNNTLTGSVPPELGNLTKLQRVWLTSNSLTGTIPSELGNWAAIRDIQFGGNQLTGSIPASFGNLTTLTSLALYTNQLTGPIPSELGNLNALTSLSIGSNQLSGTIPTALGDLTNLTNLDLMNNNLTGSIPVEIGGLTRLNTLNLRNNRLSGIIPAAIGNLTGLRYLYLNGNAFAGPVPAAMTNLTLLSWLDIGYNAFYASDPALIAFLNAKDPDWASTQTVAPADVAAEAIDGAAVRVSWTPIAFTALPGYYRVYHAQTEGGPYGLAGQTADKSAASFDVTGLNQGQTYYFVVQAHTDPHQYNFYKNSVDSEYSAEVSAVPWLQVNIGVTGTVTVGGSPLAGVVMNGLTGSPVTNASGVYSGTEAAGWSGTVTPSLAGYTFAPESRTYASITEDQTSQDYAATVIVVPTITVTAPNGGESWRAGTSHDVTWTQEHLTGSVTIDLYRGGVYQKTLGTQDATAGVFSWTIGAIETAGIDYRVLVWQGSVSDESDGVFTILRGAVKIDFNGDGQEDILWRYHGEGAYQGLNVAWLMNQTEIPSPVPAKADLAGARGRSLLSGAPSGVIYQVPRSEEAPPTITPAGGSETVLLGGKTPILDAKSVMRYPVDRGQGRSRPEGESAGVEDGRDFVIRQDAASPEALSSGNAKIASLQLATEVVFSQIPDTGWEIAGTGDFNGDGKTDILWRYYGAGDYQGLNVIWFMDGTTFVSEAVFSQIQDTNWRIAGTGDFNSDGQTDILWRYYGAGDYQGLNVIWFMNGDQMAGESVFSQVLDTDWRIEATGDFNSDGQADILWRYYGAGDYQGLNDIWFMNGATFVSEAVFSQILDTNWQIGGTGDFNGDGHTDILWRYYGAGPYQGLNDIWYMNGTTFVSEEVFSQIPDTNWRIVNR